ncbi:MAG: DUF4878 domain-containing protein [Firmicutes bacterium]|nr:DUF4878 domain-containing protein [Bacillota bacterium]
MISKKVLKSLALILVLLMVSGCSGPPNPEKTVQDFWAAFKEGDFEKANSFLSENIQVDNVEESILPGDLETSEDEMAKELLSKLDLSVKSHETKGDTATVQAIVSWPDMEILFGKFLAEALPIVFQASFSNASQEEIDLLLKPIFLDILSETPIVETPHKIELFLVNNNWVISSRPFPDPEKVFNIPDFGEDMGDESGKGSIGDAPIHPDEIPYKIDILEPDSIGSVYMEATFTNNSKYPITGYDMTILLKDKNETSYLMTYDTVMPGETSPKFDGFGPETRKPDDYEVIKLEVSARTEDKKTLFIEYDFKLNEATWHEYEE